MLTERDLEKCPVCRKRPRVKMERHPGGGAFCTIECRPWFGKPHMRVCHGKSTDDRALSYAVAEWNNLARGAALLPCPFCGSPATVEYTLGGAPYAACLECRAQHDISASEAEAVEKWNRRTPLHGINKGGTECRMS